MPGTDDTGSGALCAASTPPAGERHRAAAVAADAPAGAAQGAGRWARASGLSDFNVTYKHALKNAVTPVVTVVALTFGSVLAGAPALETTFSWPGLGYEFVRAATSLDLPVVQAITMIITVMVLVANIGLDLVYALLDPRVRIS